MAWVANFANSTADGRTVDTLNGPGLFAAGPFYVQYGAVTYGNSSTQTSLLTGTAVDLSNAQAGASPAKSLYLPGPGISQGTPLGAFPLGTTFKVSMRGSIKNNSSTPTLTFSMVLRNSAGTIISTPVTCQGTMVSTASAVTFHSEMLATVTAVGSSGSITGSWYTVIGDTATPNVLAAVPAAVTCDLTQNYYMDITATWGTGHANNTMTVNHVIIELVG